MRARDWYLPLRSLWRRPGLTAVLVGCVALGAGTNAAVFSFARGVLSAPLPFPEPQGLFTASFYQQGRSRALTRVEFELSRDALEGTASLAARSQARVTAAGPDGRSIRVQGEFVSDNYFDVLKQRPSLGQGIAEGTTQMAQVAIGDRLWHELFDASQSVIGATIRVNDVDLIVGAVMPPRVSSALGILPIDLWLPLDAAPAVLDRQASDLFSQPFFAVVGRRKPGTGLRAAEDITRQALIADMGMPSRPPDQLTPTFGSLSGLGLPPDVRPAAVAVVAVIWALALVVLGSALLNVAGLFLVRGLERQREFAIRRSLGATWWRLGRLLLLEALALAAVALPASLLLAFVLLNLGSKLLLAGSSGPGFATAARLDPAVLAFTFGACLLTIVLASLAPLVTRTLSSEVDLLRAGASTRPLELMKNLRRVVVSQLAFATVPLVLCSYFLGGMLATTTEPEPSARALVVLTLDLSQATATDPDRSLSAALAALVSQLGEQGVDTTLSDSLPFVTGPSGRASVSGRDGAAAIDAGVVAVSPNFFEFMNARALAGAPPAASQARLQVVADQSLAEALGGVPAALDGTALFGQKNFRIASVVEDIPFSQAGRAPERIVFTMLPDQPRSVSMLVRERTGVSATAAATSTLDRLIRGAGISEPVTLGTRFDRIQQARQRFVSLLAAAAVTGGLLSACGAFVLISYSVKIRRREFAIRLAVGAGARNVVGLVFRYLAQVVSTAAVIGAMLALVALKVLESVIVSSGALTAAGVGVIVSALLVIVGVAALTPALHAAHVQPSDALRID